MSVEMNQETYQKLKAKLVELYSTAENKITPDANLINDLALDSLDSVELLMAAESEFGVSISEEEANAVVTLRDLCLIIDRKMSANGTQSN